jgi:methylase of polypeptide subunit release factors
MIDLAALGFGPNQLRAWASAVTIPELRAGYDRLWARPVTNSASALLALFAAGRQIARTLLPPLGELAEYVDGEGAYVHARIAILPIAARHGVSFVVCDRLDAKGIETVCWPDDSSLHLSAAIPPGRRDTWLDLGCGSAPAQLTHPDYAHRLVASDLNPRALRYAELGARLSRVAHLEPLHGDLANVHADLITCNAPIPTLPGTTSEGPLWTSTDGDFVARMLETARAALLAGGQIVVHAALDALPGELPGELVIVAYTPPGYGASGGREFTVAWWRPDAASCRVRARRELTLARPHLDHTDREAALAGTLSPL